MGSVRLTVLPSGSWMWATRCPQVMSFGGPGRSSRQPRGTSARPASMSAARRAIDAMGHSSSSDSFPFVVMVLLHVVIVIEADEVVIAQPPLLIIRFDHDS